MEEAKCFIKYEFFILLFVFNFVHEEKILKTFFSLSLCPLLSFVSCVCRANEALRIYISIINGFFPLVLHCSFPAKWNHFMSLMKLKFNLFISNRFLALSSPVTFQVKCGTWIFSSLSFSLFNFKSGQLFVRNLIINIWKKIFAVQLKFYSMAKNIMWMVCMSVIQLTREWIIKN